MSKAKPHPCLNCEQSDMELQTKDVNIELDGLTRVVPAKRRIAPPGAMEGECWIADDFDAPVDHLFDCLKDDAA